ncbi:MAG: hypothetical protein N2554_02805, partial [Fimbriimonadales bacterium]|nr:hypothetical protein [Fimbriimonadales bacterium]
MARASSPCMPIVARASRPCGGTMASSPSGATARRRRTNAVASASSPTGWVLERDAQATRCSTGVPPVCR